MKLRPTDRNHESLNFRCARQICHVCYMKLRPTDRNHEKYRLPHSLIIFLWKAMKYNTETKLQII